MSTKNAYAVLCALLPVLRGTFNSLIGFVKERRAPSASSAAIRRDEQQQQQQQKPLTA